MPERNDNTTDDERALLKHRWAVRVNLPTDVAHVAALARRAVGVARYGALEVPADVDQAVEVLERWAAEVAGQVGGERTQLAASGLDDASFQAQLERGERS
jgi:hypothetical protein